MPCGRPRLLHSRPRPFPTPSSRSAASSRPLPAPDSRLQCLISAPAECRTPFPWPTSHRVAWFVSVPTVERAVQNWIQVGDDGFRFPSGGTLDLTPSRPCRPTAPSTTTAPSLPTDDLASLRPCRPLFLLASTVLGSLHPCRPLFMPASIVLGSLRPCWPHPSLAASVLHPCRPQPVLGGLSLLGLLWTAPDSEPFLSASTRS